MVSLVLPEADYIGNSSNTIKKAINTNALGLLHVLPLLSDFFTVCLFLSSICIPLVGALGALGRLLYCPFALCCKKEQILRLLHLTYFSFGSMLEHPEIEHFQVVFRVGSPTNRSDILANIVGMSLGAGGLSIHSGNLRTLSWDILRFCQTETG